MTLPTNPKKAQKPWIDIAVFAAVIVFLGFSVHMLLGFARRGEATLAKPEAPVKETKALALDTNSAARRPASPSPAKIEAGTSTEVLRLPCVGQVKGGKLSSEARQLQLHAEACAEDLKFPAAWKGINESSGEEIIVFVNTKEKTFSTSYFSLHEGVNKLVFTHDTGTGRGAKVGKRVETIVVERR